MSDTVRRQAKVQGVHSTSKSGGGRRKIGREFRTLVDWNHSPLTFRSVELTPKRSRYTSTRYMLRRSSPEYRDYQVACSTVTPLS